MRIPRQRRTDDDGHWQHCDRSDLALGDTGDEPCDSAAADTAGFGTWLRRRQAAEPVMIVDPPRTGPDAGSIELTEQDWGLLTARGISLASTAGWSMRPVLAAVTRVAAGRAALAVTACAYWSMHAVRSLQHGH